MSKSAGISGGGSASAAARARTPLAQMEQNLGHCTTPELACAELSKIFNVTSSEVALLRVEEETLTFLFPVELKAAGSIPLPSASAVAARTANTRKLELFNSFVIVQHANVFETIKLSTLGQSEEPGANTIQKLMSTPVIDSKQNVIGVIQVCRKGTTPDDAGADFTLADLHKLELAAKALSRILFMYAA
jgi:hypothetical protein